jgi:hypothetical protein
LVRLLGRIGLTSDYTTREHSGQMQAPERIDAIARN